MSQVDPRQIYRANSARKDALGPDRFHDEVPEKLHVFVADSTKFLQMRSPDIMKHFTGFFPQYIGERAPSAARGPTSSVCRRLVQAVDSRRSV